MINVLLRISARWGWLRAVQRLLDYGADPCELDEYGDCALQRAITGRNPDVVEHLISRCPEVVNVKMAGLLSSLCWAYATACVPKRRNKPQSPKERRSFRSLQILLEAGALRFEKEDILGAAVKSGDLPIVQILISFGADPRKPDDEGVSPLDVANAMDDQEILNLLHNK